MKLILKYSLLTLCFILFKTTVVFSQTTSVTVLSAKDSTAIKEVSFFSLNLKEVYYTNKKGKVNFEIDSSAIFKIFKQEFYSKTIQLKKGQSITIYLDPFDFLLEGVTIEDEYRKGKITQAYLRKVEKMFVYHAKKSERIKVGDKDANLATNNT